MVRIWLRFGLSLNYNTTNVLGNIGVCMYVCVYTDMFALYCVFYFIFSSSFSSLKFPHIQREPSCLCVYVNTFLCRRASIQRKKRRCQLLSSYLCEQAGHRRASFMWIEWMCKSFDLHRLLCIFRRSYAHSLTYSFVRSLIRLQTMLLLVFFMSYDCLHVRRS